MSEVETAIEEINQIMIQYRAEVARGRKAWPRSIKDRAIRLSEIGVKAKVIAERTGIPYYTVLKWRPQKLKPRGRFRELAVIGKPLPAQKMVTVTVPQTEVALPQKVATVTVTTSDGFRIEVPDVTAVVQMIHQLRKAAGVPCS